MDIQLPFDIYACILHYCSRRDLLALRLTNKSLSDASDPFLYRHIQFDFYAKTIAEAEKEFFRIRGLYEQLRHDKEKAGFVRRLEVREMNHLTVSPACVIPSFTPFRHTRSTGDIREVLNDSRPQELETRHQLFMVQLAVAALVSVLPSLEVFHVSGTKKLGNHLAPLELLEYITCPHLKEFRLEVTRDDIWFPPRPTLSSFFERHSQLQTVVLAVEQPTGRGLLSTADKCLEFPTLRRFSAPAGGYFERMSADTPLLEAEIDFRSKVDSALFPTLELELIALQRFSTLTSLIITRSPQDVDTIVLIAKNLPQLEQLEVRHTDLTYRLPLQPDRIEAFAEALSGFSSLQRLTYRWTGHGRMRTMVDRNDEINRRTVVSWGKACPSLEFCNLYGSVWERTDGKWSFT